MRFAWLLGDDRKRGDLIAARAAVANGRLDACARMELAEVLAALRAREGLTPRELARLDEVALAIAAADRRDPALRAIRRRDRP